MKHQQSIGLVVLGAVLGSALTLGIQRSWDDAEALPPPTQTKAEPRKPAPEKLDSESDKDEFTREIDGDCVFSGRVLTADGNPVPDASIGLWLMDQPWSDPQPRAKFTSNDDGRFELDGVDEKLPIILYTIKKGFAPATLKKPACNTPLELEIEPGGELRIIATNAENKPVEGAEIIVAGDSIWPPRVGTADDDGELVVAGAPFGEYQLWGSRGRLSGSKAFSLTSSDESKDVRVALTDTAESKLEVYEATEKSSLRGVPFFVSPEGMPLLEQPALTDEHGRIAARCPSPAGCRFELGPYPAAEMASHNVRAGEAKRIPLDKGSTISGTVTDPDDFPVSGASLVVLEQVGKDMVALRNERANALLGRLVTSAIDDWPSVVTNKDNSFIGPMRLPVPDIPCLHCETAVKSTSSSLTDESGRFVVQGLPPRSISLIAEHPEMVMIGRPVEVDLGNRKQLADVSIKMRRGSVATIRVVDDRGIPITGAEVTAYDTQRELLRNIQSDDDGYVEFKGLPGDFRIEATHDTYISSVSNIDGKTGVVMELTLTLDPADKVLRGRVKDQRGFGIKGAEVIAKSIERGHPQVLTGVTADDGSFELPGAGRGRYCIRADAGRQGKAFVSELDFREETKLVLGSGAAEAGESSFADYTVIEPENTMGGAAALPSDTANVPRLGADNLGVTSGSDEPAPVTSIPTNFGDADELPVTGPPSGKGGLPIKIGAKGGGVVVTAVSTGSRVEIAGLIKGSRILSVDGHPVRGPADAKKALSGPIGSVVMLEVAEPGSDVPFTIVVQRVPAQ